MTSLTDPDNNITTWTYTHANEVATEVSPLGHPTTYSYDLNGNVTSVIDPEFTSNYVFVRWRQRGNRRNVGPPRRRKRAQHCDDQL